MSFNSRSGKRKEKRLILIEFGLRLINENISKIEQNDFISELIEVTVNINYFGERDRQTEMGWGRVVLLGL